MKKFTLMLNILCMPVVLVACKNGNDTMPISQPTTTVMPNISSTAPIQNTVFNFSTFDVQLDEVNSKAIYNQLDYQIRNSNISAVVSYIAYSPLYHPTNVTITTNPSTTPEISNPISPTINTEIINYYTGKGFFSTVPTTQQTSLLSNSAKILNDHSYQVSYPTSNLTKTVDITEFDLTDKNNFVISDTYPKKGVITDVNEISSFYEPSINHDFPQGSQCYILRAKSSVANYQFSNKTLIQNSNITTLEQFVAYAQTSTIRPPITQDDGLYESVKILSATDVVYENVGVNNELPAVHFKDQYGQYHAAVIYLNNVYVVHYADTVSYDDTFDGKFINNNINIQSRVDCLNYNKVAADYIAGQLKLINF